MIDLSKNVADILAAKSVSEKQIMIREMITASHAKATTKNTFTAKVNSIFNLNKLDKLAVDYMLAGEGLKVI